MPRDPRPAARRLLRRRRRPIAAMLAGIGALLALTTLRGAPAPVVADLPGHALGPGEVVVPVVLTSGAVASVLSVGDIVDILGFSDADPPTAAVIARRARVFDLPSSTAFGSSVSPVVLIAVPQDQALPLSAASAGGGVSVLLHDR